MSDAAKKKPEAEAPKEGGDAHGKDGAKAAGGGMLTKLPVLLGGVMIIEAVVLFAGFKFLASGGPQQAAGAPLVTDNNEGHGGAEGEKEGATPAEGGHEAAAKEGEGEAKGKEGEAKGEGKEGAPAAAPIDKKKPYEILVAEFRAPNKMSGRTFLYDLKIVAITKGVYQKKVSTTMTERASLIQDRVRTIIAQMDPEKLAGRDEPGLETLRRQVKYQLDEIVGEGMIDEVLVPKCLPIRTDF